MKNNPVECEEIYGKQSGIESKYFSESTGIRIHTGEIIMGFDNGLYYFNPEQVRKSTTIPSIVFKNDKAPKKFWHF